jgi:RND family efflux transporter MFP subunit
MNKNLKLSLIVLSILIILVIGKKVFKNDKSNDLKNQKNISQVSKILVEKSVPKKISAEIEINGYIDAKDTITIIPQTYGIVKEIIVSQGQKIKEGDIILTIDEKDKVKAVKSAELLVQQKKKELNISNNLLKTGDTPLTLNNQAKTSYEDALTQLEKARNELDFTKVKATISGYVDKINVKKGDYVDDKSIITKIFDDRNFIAAVSIPQSRVQTIEPGQKAKVFVEGKEFNGVLKFVSNIADQKTKNYYGEVSLNLNEKDKNFIMKMMNVPIQIKISYNELPAIQLNDSITFLDDEGYITLKVLDKDNVVTSIPVEILSSDKTGVSWFHSNYFEKNKEVNVIVRGGGFVNDGDKIDNIDYVDK